MRYVLALVLVAAPASADCVRMGAGERCVEADGTVTITRQLGAATVVEGKNADSGAAWKQRSLTVDGFSSTVGRGADGGRWRWNSQTIGGRTYTRGVDPQGRAFTQVCDRFRCY